jgi:hypothetical protein
MASRTLVRKQLRGFVVLWTAITAVVAGVTFFAIYLTYDTGRGPTFAQNIAFPSATGRGEDDDASAIAAQVTAPPTLAIAGATATTGANPASPTESADAALSVAQAATSGTAEPTQRPRRNQTRTAEAALLTQAAPTLTPTISPLEDPNFRLGIQVQHSIDMNQDNMDGYIRDVRQKMGLRWVKFQVRWNEIETEEGVFNWDKMELMATSARKFGVNLMVSVVAAPEWAWAPGITPTGGQEVPPQDAQDFVDFVTRIADGYRDVVKGIEVWNEQNLDREWYTGRSLTNQDAADYVDLLRQVYEGVKAVNPDMIVISGALAPSGGWTEADGRVSAMDDFAYMDAMIAAGLLNYTDCVGVHHNGYNISPSVLWDQVPDDPTASYRGPFENPHHSWSFRSTLETYNTKIKAAGGEQQLCVTEFGWASTEDLEGTRQGFEFAADNTLAEQAEWTIEAIENMEEWGFVKLAFIWNYNYAPQAGWATDNDNVPYSFIGPNWTFRPVYDAVVEWQAGRE